MSITFDNHLDVTMSGVWTYENINDVKLSSMETNIQCFTNWSKISSEYPHITLISKILNPGRFVPQDHCGVWKFRRKFYLRICILQTVKYSPMKLHNMKSANQVKHDDEK